MRLGEPDRGSLSRFILTLVTLGYVMLMHIRTRWLLLSAYSVPSVTLKDGGEVGLPRQALKSTCLWRYRQQHSRLLRVTFTGNMERLPFGELALKTVRLRVQRHHSTLFY